MVGRRLVDSNNNKRKLDKGGDYLFQSDKILIRFEFAKMLDCCAHVCEQAASNFI